MDEKEDKECTLDIDEFIQDIESLVTKKKKKKKWV